VQAGIARKIVLRAQREDLLDLLRRADDEARHLAGNAKDEDVAELLLVALEVVVLILAEFERLASHLRLAADYSNGAERERARQRGATGASVLPSMSAGRDPCRLLTKPSVVHPESPLMSSVSVRNS
jgi:hypothetical protein